MRFWYQQYEVAPQATGAGATVLYRPEIPVRIIGGTDDDYLLGLLDSGADEVILPWSIAEKIGAEIDEDTRWSIRGFAGQHAQAVLGHIELAISDGSETHRWPALVGLVRYDNPLLEQLALLGRRGFLELFNVEFRGEDHQVVIEPNATFPRS